MKPSKDVLQKIAEKSDDKTALRLLSSNKELNNDYYFRLIFGSRYPDLIEYKNEIESFRHSYLRFLKAIGQLKEQYNYKYVSGNPTLQLRLLRENNKNMDFLLVEAAKVGSIEMAEYAKKNRCYPIYYALRIAIINGRLDMVKYLLNNGADIQVIDEEFLTFVQSNFGHLDRVKIVVDYVRGLLQ